MTNLRGLIIGDNQVLDDENSFNKYTKYLIVPKNMQSKPEFDSLTLANAGSLADPMRLQIVEAMQNSSSANSFANLESVIDNILFRISAMETFVNFNSGAYDADYFSDILKIQSCMGWFTSTGQTSSNNWRLMDSTDYYSGQFVETGTSTPSVTMAPTIGTCFPFRGECAGAFQMAVYLGLLNGLGDSKFDALADKFGKMYIGPWKIDEKTPNPATLFMSKADLADPLIPGDYLYFKNKNDYSTLAPKGFWQGLNAMYMGKDALGTPHFSGLGAAWLSEANLRISVADAYYHDCYPNTISDPDKDCRFTLRYKLEIPTSFAKPTTVALTTGATPVLAVTNDVLQNAGFAAVSGKRASVSGQTLGDLSSYLGFDPKDLKQTRSAPLENPSHQIALNGGMLLVEYENHEDGRSDPSTRVSAHMTMDD